MINFEHRQVRVRVAQRKCIKASPKKYSLTHAAKNGN